MARYNEILVGRYNRLVQKLFSMKGPASLVTVADELMPVLPFFHGVENRYLEAWDRFGLQVTQGNVAAQNAAVRLRNPAGSNVIMVVEKIAAFNASSAADVLRLSIARPFNTDLATVATTTGTGFDGRGRANPTAVISSGNNVVNPGTEILLGQHIAGGQVDFITDIDQEVPLTPNMVIQVAQNAVNNSLVVGFWWRERFLEDSERA